MILPAISIMQPWPYAILHFGKDFENRSWRLPPQYIGVPVLIHAGKKRDWDGDIYLRDELGLVTPAELPQGGIVGFVMFTIQCGQRRPSVWAAQGLHNWPIVASGALGFHPCPGRLGFFKVSYPHPLPERVC